MNLNNKEETCWFLLQHNDEEKTEIDAKDSWEMTSWYYMRTVIYLENEPGKLKSIPRWYVLVSSSCA